MVLIWAVLHKELRSINRPIATTDYWTKTPFRQWITTAMFNVVYGDCQATPSPPPSPVTADPVGVVGALADTAAAARPQQRHLQHRKVRPNSYTRAQD